MKTPLLKTSLICLGVILLCGLYSFKTPNGENLQQRYQTESISNDTIITLEGENSQCIREVVVRDLSKCICTLHVNEGNGAHGDWHLYVHVSCDCDVIVTYDYIVYYADGTNYEPPVPVEKECVFGDNYLNVSGSMSNSRCCPVSITARLAQE